MIGRKLITGTLLICLPAACATALSVAGYRLIVPRLEDQERMRVQQVYRETAEELKADRTKGAGIEPVRRGQWLRMKPGRWGYAEGRDTTIVWYEARNRLQSVSVARVKPSSVGNLMLAVLSASLFLFWGLTLCGCWVFRRSVKERDDFVAATAHDLTTPLVALRRLIGRDDEEAKVLTERMLRLVKNLTDFLKLSGRRPSPKIETVDLRKSYDEAYSLFREDYRWLFDGKDVAVEGPETLLAAADATMVVQILWNLLANDLKYAAPYGPVSVRFVDDDACVAVSFVDGGKGLTSAERSHIFDRYYRAKSVMTSGKGGFGIGLCTAREFARAMGGDLTVAANEPTGCVFTLKLRKAR